ncbi:restriction endonuclease subunit S [Pseudoalteromonas fuliginea]|uniref:restriction endonuclease subunit S n=1 Tax=Pseudoalteromonas fuliginea TaxID=1872678 RepID=UPI003175C8C5
MSWPLVSIGSIAKVVGGYAFKSKDFVEVGSPIVRISNVKNGIVDLSKAARIPEHKLENGKKYNIETGSLLIAMSGATTGKVGRYFPLDDNPAYLNQRVGKFDCNESLINQDYLWFFTQSSTCQKQIGFLAEGAAQPNISGSQIESIEIPLPPLETQKKIAAVLEKADQLRKDCKLLEQELNSLAESVFIDMFGDPVTNPKGWEVAPLDTVTKVQIGPFGSQLHKEDYISDGIPLINPTHIVKGSIIPDTNLTLTIEKFNTLPNYHLMLGDIIMGRRGEMGRTALVDDSCKGWFCGTGSLFIRPKSKLIQSVYLNSLMSCSSMKTWLEEQSLGATMPNLNKKILHSIQVPIPPKKLQTNYAVALDILKNQRLEHKQQVKELNMLFNTLMQKAFKGELNL